MSRGSADYIRRTYGIPAKRGARIAFNHTGRRLGTITGFRGACILVRFDDDQFRKYPTALHPTWEVEYLDGGAS
jgi:hypothetical protein